MALQKKICFTQLAFLLHFASFALLLSAQSAKVNLLIINDTSACNQNFNRLKNSLVLYREIEKSGGWNRLPEVKKKISEGIRDTFVLMLRERLKKENYTPASFPAWPDSFDAGLKKALQLYQRAHGLDTSGIADAATIRELNVPVSTRILQMEINLDRWKKNGCPEEPFIFINIPAFSLEVIEGGKSIRAMKIIAGRVSRPTYEFNSEITQIEFNPAWYVPPVMLRTEVLPDIIRDPGSLERKRMLVYTIENGTTKKIPADSIQWKNVQPGNFPYKLVQAPGPVNPMGKIKFMFPNKYRIYMHDTPFRGLFDKNIRAFSNGCIRVEKAKELAVWLLKDEPGMDEKKIEELMETPGTESIRILSPVKLYIRYFTAWTDENGIVHFRKDIYKKDRK